MARKTNRRGKNQSAANGANKGATGGKVRMKRVPGTKTMARPRINNKGR